MVSRKASRENCPYPADPSRIMECDLGRSQAAVGEIVRRVQPDIIFHLAAVTSEKVSRKNPQKTYTANVLGTLHLLESVRQAQIDPVVLIAGSSAEFGWVKPEENPVKETNPLRPVSFYGASKVAQGMLARQYHLAYALKIVQTIAFNYLGPRQSDQFVCSAFAKQIAQIEKGLIPPEIHVGNTETLRDFTDVRDVVKAYWLIGTQGTPGETYNICSGNPVSIRDILEQLLRLSPAKIKVTQDAFKRNPLDVPFQAGDYGKLHEAMGWRPIIPLENSLRDTLDYWRATI